jgi:arabinofuranosyltransferase
VLLAGVLVAAHVGDAAVANHASRWRENFAVRSAAGAHLRDHFPSDTLVALNPAGIIPYVSRLPTLDMLGLNDVHIAHYGRRDLGQQYAHQAGDGQYVLSRRPGVILFRNKPHRLPNERVSSVDLWADPEFHASYEVQEWPGIGHAYVRRVE